MIRQIEKAKRKRKTYSAPALEKGLDILELLSSHSSGLSLNNITKLLNRSVGEIFRMVVVLEQRGYLESVPNTDQYRLTAKMFSVSHRYAPIEPITIVAVPVMRELSRTTHQSCHLVIYHLGRGIIVSQQDSPTDRGFHVRLGAEAPLTDSCSGHVLLSFASRDERSLMLAEQPKRFRKRFSKARLEKLLDAIRDRGYERVNSAQVQGVIDIGFPIFDYTASVRAVLVIPFLTRMDGSNRVNTDTATRYLSNAAAEISALLGFQPTRTANAD